MVIEMMRCDGDGDGDPHGDGDGDTDGAFPRGLCRKRT